MKNKLIIGLLIILIGVLFINRFVTHIVWVNPQVNTKVFSYISPVLKQLSMATERAVLSLNTEKTDAKVLYQNAYGSGFINGNKIPNDLDYSVGIYLGQYEYDGKNAKAIAGEIADKMAVFETEFYNYINDYTNGKFYSNMSAMDSIHRSYEIKTNNVNAIAKSLPRLFSHKDYVVYTDKTVYTEDNVNGIQIVLPFILRKNEILIEDYSPIELFSPIVKYSSKTRKMLRGISIVATFYADIKKGDDVVRAELVAESFTGQRLQLERRFYVPIIFVGENSANYLKNLSILKDDDQYIKYRLFNYRRHIQEFSNLSLNKERPIKLLKRLLQCKELIAPALEPEIANDISETVEILLSSKKIQLINDYETAYSNLLEITSNPYMSNSIPVKVIDSHIDEMENIIKEMKASGTFRRAITQKLKKYTKELELPENRTPEAMQQYNEKILANAEDVFEILDNQVQKMIPEKVYGFMNDFMDIMTKSGFHKITMGWVAKDTMGIVKDDFTSKIPPNELRKMARENDLIDVNYRLINAKELDGLKIRYSLWVRYNTTEDENKVWNNMKSRLIKDKNNFSIKHKYVIPISF